MHPDLDRTTTDIFDAIIRYEEIRTISLRKNDKNTNHLGRCELTGKMQQMQHHDAYTMLKQIIRHPVPVAFAVSDTIRAVTKVRYLPHLLYGNVTLAEVTNK